MSPLAQLIALWKAIMAGFSGLNLPPPDITKPTIALAVSDSRVEAEGIVTLTLSANDAGGIKAMRLSRNGVLIASPLSSGTLTDKINRQDTPNGAYTYLLVVEDQAGNTEQASAAVEVDIPAPVDTTAPTVSLMASSLRFEAEGSLLLTCVGTDDMAVTSLTLTRDGTIIPIPADGKVTEGITRASNGTHTYLLTAADAAGNSSVDGVTVTVAIPAPGPTAPTMRSFTMPGRTGTNITEAGDVAFHVDATDDVGINTVLIYRREREATRKDMAPYDMTIPFTAADNGPCRMRARAYNAAGKFADLVIDLTVNIPVGNQPPASSLLTRSRRRADYVLPNTPITLTKAALLSGAYGSPNADGWYEIRNLRCHSLTPGVACVRLKYMGPDVDLKVKLIDYVFDGLGVPGFAAGGLVVGEADNSLWLDNGLSFSSPPPVGGNGVRCFTARCAAMSGPREFIVTNGEAYGAGGYYVDRIGGSTAIPYRQIRVTGSSCYNLRGTGYNADGSLNMENGRLSIKEYIGYSAQFFQINNAPNTPNVLVDFWTVHNDPDAMIGREAGQAEDMWNVHSSSGVPGSPITFRQYLVENGLPWDGKWTGVEAEYGRDERSPTGLGYPYSGSGGLNDGYTRSGFSGTPTADDVPHHVHAEDGTSLNNLNVGFGVTAGNRATARRITAYTAGFIPSRHPSGSSRIIPRNSSETINGVKTGNNAVQGMQFYKAQGDNALFYGHEFDDLEGAYCWLDDSGTWRRKTLYVADPNGDDAAGFPKSFKFRQGGVVKLPYQGGMTVMETPTSQADAIAKLGAVRKRRLDAFIAAGRVIGMRDRAAGDVTNYWQRGAGA